MRRLQLCDAHLEPRHAGSDGRAHASFKQLDELASAA